MQVYAVNLFSFLQRNKLEFFRWHSLRVAALFKKNLSEKNALAYSFRLVDDDKKVLIALTMMIVLLNVLSLPLTLC